MRPLKLNELHMDYKTDHVADCVLEVLADFGDAVTTQTFVNKCLQEGAASPATVYKKISQLKGLGFIADVEHAQDKDGRKAYIQVTREGLGYLKKFD